MTGCVLKELEEARKRITEFETLIKAIAKAMKAYHDSDLVSLATTLKHRDEVCTLVQEENKKLRGLLGGLVEVCIVQCFSDDKDEFKLLERVKGY
jgi:DNA repair ATPase RecN